MNISHGLVPSAGGTHEIDRTGRRGKDSICLQKKQKVTDVDFVICDSRKIYIL